MSHMNTYQTQMTQVPAIALACKRLGLTFKENQKTAEFYRGQKANCNHAIGIPGTSYEVGLCKMDSGAYEFKADWYDQHVGNAIGMEGVKLQQEYAAAATILEAQRQHATVVSEERLENGAIRLRLRSW